MQKSVLRASRMEPLSVQNGASEPPKWSPGPPKWSPRPPKWFPKWSKLVQDRSKWSLRLPKRRQEGQADPQEAVPEGPGRPKWGPMGHKTCQNPPKSSQNGGKIELKWGQKPVQNGIRFGVLKNIDFLLIFR